MTKARSAKVVESRTIDHIPEDARYGKPLSLFTLWWSTNMQITPVVTGALAVVLGLNLGWAIFAIVVGNLLGGVVMAYHSAQGPKLGLPQMIQSRAQFGVLGALLPLLTVVVMAYGFFAVSAVLGGQAISALIHVPNWAGIMIVDALTMVLAMFGYEFIHRYERWMAVALGIVFLAITIRLFAAPHLQTVKYSVTAGTVLLAISFYVTWQITYAPYVSDYSRYLPTRTSISTTFWYTYLGTVLSSTWMMCLGAAAAVLAENQISNNTATYLGNVFGSSVADIVFIAVVLGIIAANVLNLYTPFLTFMAMVEPFVTLKKSAGIVLRLVVCLVGALIGTLLAVLGEGTSFFTNFSNFLVFLLYVMIPWTAINLVDFYLVKRGRYSIPDFFDVHGMYGSIKWKTIAVYLGTIGVEVPFMNSAIYVGPLPKYMGGADISWLVGLVVASTTYYLVADRTVPSEERTPAPATTTGGGAASTA